ncbi:MAG: 2-methylfumaryl-CoA isomerase [Chloroflexi bacterium]|nr:2-methylfumaryl-CoA isomerase [Chloroflexota bacterium]
MSAPLLRGLRVVELSAFVAAPLAGTLLTELGAEVVRVDPIGGGVDRYRWPLHHGTSVYWAGLNQGKRSVTVDMRSAEGARIVGDLIAAAGTCITNLPPQKWMAYDALRAKRPDVVQVVLSGNGDGSIAVDYTVNAATGFPWVTGPESATGPVNHVLPAWDVIAGHSIATAVVAAELHRARTGEGQLVRLSLADVALATAAHLGFLGEAQLGTERGRYGNNIYGSYGHEFQTADGRWLIVASMTPRHWDSLVAATDSKAEFAALEARSGVDLHHDASRFVHRAEISAVFAPWFAGRTLADAARALDEHGVLWGPYQTFTQLLADDPRASAANPMLNEVRHPGLPPVRAAGSPLFFSGADHLPASPAPAVGGDTRGVLREWLGLDDGALDALAKERIVAA